jgi:hypothetical protein
MFRKSPKMKGDSKMSRNLSRTFTAFMLFAAVLVLLAAPEARSETYSSLDDKYPTGFCNDIFDTLHNDMSWMDSVYFGGREIVFFTVFSTCGTSYDSKLYFFTHDPETHGSVDISNNTGLDFKIKLVEYNDVLYIFYTTGSNSSGYNTGTIYYRTATVNRGATGTDWVLEFSGLKSFPAGVSSANIRMAHVLEDTLYVIFSAGSTWYAISSPDGLTFDPEMTLFSASGVKGAGGAVFQVPDPDEGSLDRLMIAYATGSAVKYYFFDGTTLYGDPHAGNGAYVLSSSGVYPYSVRLIAGSGNAGYSNSLYSIQVFIASPKDSGSNQTWNNIYHREYIPAGVNGNEGSWSSTWTHLGNSGDDDIKSVNTYDPDRGWAVIPLFTSSSPDPSANIQMYLRIWYTRGTNYSWPSTDHVEFRCSYYKSDILVHQPRTVTGTAHQDMSTYTVLGVIEGTPPYPKNKGVPTAEGSNTSVVEFGQSDDVTVETSWTVGGSVMAYFGMSWEKKGGWKTKLTAGVKYTKNTKTSSTTSKTKALKNFIDEPPGDLGWVAVLIPEMYNDPYILKAYDGHSLYYSDDTSGNEVTVSLITYGPNSRVDLLAYYLQEPYRGIGQPEESPHTLLDGMAARPLSTNIKGDPGAPADSADRKGWVGVTEEYANTANPPWTVTNLATKDPQGVFQNLSLWSTSGETTNQTITYSTAEGHTWSPSASFTASADKLGLFTFGGEITANWSMDIKTTSTMTAKLGFWYNIPECCDPVHYDCTGLSCISTMQVDPKLLVPEADASGYNAPWISNDIRNFTKPKPWCLTYMTYPIKTGNALNLQRVSLRKADAFLYYNRLIPNRDRVSASLTLSGVGPGVIQHLGRLLHLSLGAYVVNSDITPVIYKCYQGNTFVVGLMEAANPDSSIRVTLSYDRKESLLNVELDARQVNLPDPGNLLEDGYGVGSYEAAFPVGLFMGSRYYAQDTLGGRITVNKRKIICELHAER